MQVCSRCVFDERIPGLTFDAEGVCNYCKLQESMEKEYPTGKEGEEKLKEFVEEIKKTGENKPYDCVVGVSGGCDSSYLLYLTKKLGLRPLAAHYDNTWDSTIAVENIHKMINKLKIDLHTRVVNNEEMNDIFKSFLKASVPEIEAPTDVGFATTAYEAAAKYGLKYILLGSCFRTEGTVPLSWFYFDGKYIESIHKQFGEIKMKTFPNLWLSKWLKWLTINKIKRPNLLYYIDYDKEKVKKFLTEEFGWQWYSGHHMDNTFTIFSNKYYLPRKFGIDFRFVEYSGLIRSGRITREEALRQLQDPLPACVNEVSEVKKRFRLSDAQFEDLMAAPRKSAADYKTYNVTFRRMKPLFWVMYKANMVPKSFYVKYTN